MTGDCVITRKIVEGIKTNVDESVGTDHAKDNRRAVAVYITDNSMSR